MSMNDNAREHADHVFGAQYDDTRERYASELRDIEIDNAMDAEQHEYMQKKRRMMTNAEREELVEKIAVLLDESGGGSDDKVVKDGDLEPIYELIKHYQRKEDQ